MNKIKEYAYKKTSVPPIHTYNIYTHLHIIRYKKRVTDFAVSSGMASASDHFEK